MEYKGLKAVENIEVSLKKTQNRVSWGLKCLPFRQYSKFTFISGTYEELDTFHNHKEICRKRDEN